MLPPVLLEFEGVLASTGEPRRDALRRALADDGVAVPDGVYEAHCAGRPVREAVTGAARATGAPLDEVAIDLAAIRAERYFAERFGKGTLLAPGAREFVEAAHGTVPLAIVTRASRREVDFALRLADLLAAFDCIVTADDVPRAKPAPDGYALALQRLARRRPLAPAAEVPAIALEDAPAGIAGARAAGLACVAVGAIPAYQAVTADAYVDTLAGQTPAWLARLASHGQERMNHEQH